jgi:hypothetical protein
MTALSVLQFANAHPYIFALLFTIVVMGVVRLAVWPFRLVNRWFRHLNIKAHGWPPPHVDADGDVVMPPK